MGILSKLFGRQPRLEAPAAEETQAPECFHGVLVAKWDSAEDLGNEEKATSFTCESCGSSFSPEEARVLRDSMAERLVGR